MSLGSLFPNPKSLIRTLHCESRFRSVLPCLVLVFLLAFPAGSGAQSPDLIISAISTTTTAVAPAGSVTLSSSAKNVGTLSSPSFVIAFHLSSDSVYGGSDIAFTTTRSVASLGVGATSTASTTLTVPPTTPLGSYFICGFADSQSSVGESSETNNTRCTASSIQVSRPDLVMAGVSTTATRVRGSGVG